MFRREVLERKGFARPDTDTGEFVANVLVLCGRRHELQGGVEILEEVRLDPSSSSWDKIDLRRGWRSGLLEVRGKRLRLVSRLHLHHVRHVSGIEELGPVAGDSEGGSRGKDLLDPCGSLAFPAGADDEIITRLASCGATADVAEVVGIAVAKHHCVIALLFHCGYRDHHRLRTQIQPEK